MILWMMISFNMVSILKEVVSAIHCWMNDSNIMHLSGNRDGTKYLNGSISSFESIDSVDRLPENIINLIVQDQMNNNHLIYWKLEIIIYIVKLYTFVYNNTKT